MASVGFLAVLPFVAAGRDLCDFVQRPQR
jgi:hypothetical protein